MNSIFKGGRRSYIDYRLFPNIEDRDHKTYKTDGFIIPFFSAFQKTDERLMLLTGESSIGKSTTLRLIESEVLNEGIVCFLYECKKLNEETIKKITQFDINVKNAIFLFDAYDELDRISPETFFAMIFKLYRSANTQKIVLSSRAHSCLDDLKTQTKNNDESNIEYKTFEMRGFSDNQLETIIGEDSALKIPMRELLRNTMLLSMYLEIKKSASIDDSFYDITDEAEFLKQYLWIVYRSKMINDTGSNVAEVKIKFDRLIFELGAVVHKNRMSELSLKAPNIPDALSTVFEELKVDGGYIVDARHKKWLDFAQAYYLKTLIEDMCNGAEQKKRISSKDLLQFKEFFKGIFPNQDMYYYTGQLLVGRDPNNENYKVYIKALIKRFIALNLSVQKNFMSFALGLNKDTVNDAELHPILMHLLLRRNGFFQSLEHFRSLIIGHSIRGIRCKHFEMCEKLEYIFIERKIIKIEQAAFYGCALLKEISVSQGNRRFIGEGNCVMTRLDGKLILGCKNSVINEKLVKKVAVGAFYGKNLGERVIEVPDNIYVPLDSVDKIRYSLSFGGSLDGCGCRLICFDERKYLADSFEHEITMAYYKSDGRESAKDSMYEPRSKANLIMKEQCAEKENNGSIEFMHTVDFFEEYFKKHKGAEKCFERYEVAFRRSNLYQREALVEKLICSLLLIFSFVSIVAYIVFADLLVAPLYNRGASYNLDILYIFALLIIGIFSVAFPVGLSTVLTKVIIKAKDMSFRVVIR